MLRDLSPVTVSGAVTASRARAIWRDGTLAIFTAADECQTLATAEPKRARSRGSNQIWETTTDAGDPVTMLKSCGCGGTNPLGKLPRASLLASIS